MLTVLAAALLAQAHVHESGAGAASGKDAAVPMFQLAHQLDPDAPKPEGTTTKLQVAGQSSEAYLARPRGKPRGALLVLQEYWGLNDWIKHQADQLAKDGYLALAVDLYQGKVASTPAEAVELMKAKDEARGDGAEHASPQIPDAQLERDDPAPERGDSRAPVAGRRLAPAPQPT